jgi:hypothetical protein
LPVSIEANKNKKQNGERKKRGSSITDKWQWNSDHGRKPNCHTYIDHQMKEKYSSYSVGITSAENAPLSFGDCNYPE